MLFRNLCKLCPDEAVAFVRQQLQAVLNGQQTPKWQVGKPSEPSHALWPLCAQWVAGAWGGPCSWSLLHWVCDCYSRLP